MHPTLAIVTMKIEFQEGFHPVISIMESIDYRNRSVEEMWIKQPASDLF